MDFEPKSDPGKEELQTRKNELATAILGMQVQGLMLEYYIWRLELSDDQLGLQMVDKSTKGELKKAMTVPVDMAYRRYSGVFRTLSPRESELSFKDFEDYVLGKINEKLLNPAREGLGVPVSPQEINTEIGRQSDIAVGEMLVGAAGEVTSFRPGDAGDFGKYESVQKTLLAGLERNGIDQAGLRYLRSALFRMVFDLREGRALEEERLSRARVDAVVGALGQRSDATKYKDLTMHHGVIPGKLKR